MKHKIPTLLCLLLALASCGKSSLETTFANQSTKIDTYVTKQLESHPEYRVEYNDGVVRMVVAEGEGTELAKGGSVTFYYAGYNFNNNSISAGTMFATNDQDIAASAKWDLSDSTAFLPVTVTLGKDKLVHGLELGLNGVRSGEDCFIFFSGRHGFGKRQIGTIPANAALCYHVRVEEVID
jgi:FKBP-type peptidyl-prolyl cis-trans isomerase